MKKTEQATSMPALRLERDQLRQRVEDYVADHALVPPLSMEELRNHAEQIPCDAGQRDYVMVLLNNAVWHETVASIPYSRRLLLLPQCLRNFKVCPARMDEFGLLCEECGACPIGELQRLAEDVGYVVLVAEGSTVVSKLLEGGKVDAVVGVSCLSALEKSFPHMADGAIPGLAIPLTVDGCISTQTDVDHVREAILLKSGGAFENRVDHDVVRAQVDAWFDGVPETETVTERIGYEWMMKNGKRWRPFLLASTYRALTPDQKPFPEDVKKLALAVECFHKASLVHDDIEDDDDLRYGEPTLHVQHGLPVALNVGDFLVGEGYRWIAATEFRTVELFNVASENHRTLCVGQGEELVGLEQGHAFSAEEMIEIFRKKTSPAFGVSLMLGAVAAGADDDLIQILARFSESLGIAYQVKDDLDEYRSGEAVDLRASIIMALANDQHPEISNAVRTPELEHLLEELMVVEKANQMLEHYANEAARTLNALNNASLKSLLRQLTSKLIRGA